MTIFAGIDLAWSGRRPTGVCVLATDGNGVVLVRIHCTTADTSAEGIAALLDTLGPDVIAGIDGPLVVGEDRRAEGLLAREFGKFGVFAYAARMDFLERHGIAEGPRLGSMLEAAGWNLDPSVMEPRTAGRHALEVFPHATIVSLLGAPAALKYKKGKLVVRWSELAVFQRLLREYAARELPAAVDCPALSVDVAGHSARDLKEVEDQLDALTCALAAHHAWKHGSAGLRLFGDGKMGYIAVPYQSVERLAPGS